MPINTVTHLNFRGDARDALAFYRSVFGGEQKLISYADAHSVQDPSEADQIMWGQVAADNGFRIMAYDVPSATAHDPGEIPFFVSVRGEDAEEISGHWTRLCEGSTVVRPLEPAGWATLYGMVKDRFGVTWVLDVVSPTAHPEQDVRGGATAAPFLRGDPEQVTSHEVIGTTGRDLRYGRAVRASNAFHHRITRSSGRGLPAASLQRHLVLPPRQAILH
jgi:PhnB protein